ncbi:NECA3 protein, partial [Brachypteracias leptosomus]|nr:NECA3 protein [Brachypteracias leptosomus]
MACAELLAVCLLSADRGPAPRRQPLPIFHDVSSAKRAPDDGKLSFEEFKNYFADGILSSEELWELFSGIDRRHSDNVDTEKLCGKFGDTPALEGLWWGFGGALCTAELGSQGALTILYETSSKMEQFLTRFLLRETMHQLQSLQTSLECAVDTVEEQAGRERKDMKKSETTLSLRSGRRCGRRGQKNVCLSPTDPYSGMLTTGTAAWLSLGLVSVHPEPGGAVGAAAQDRGACPGWSLDPTNGWWHWGGCPVPACQAGSEGGSCPHSVSACKLTDEACFILYEFWQDVTSWRSHLQSSCSKTFQRSIISLLESPELLTTMLFPASWWIMNNN